MGYSRKDQVYVLSNFFSLVLVGFTCFMSSDFIRLLTFDTIGNESYWIFVYHIAFWLFTISAMLVRAPAAPCLMYCIRLNIIFILGMCILFYKKWVETISFHTIIILWAYLIAVVMVNAVTYASYHTSGSRGLALGCMLSFGTTYIVLEILKYAIWAYGAVGRYRNVVIGYLVLRAIVSFLAMAILSISAERLHFADFDRAFASIKKGVLHEWLSGTLHDIEIRIALSEVVPRYVSPMEGFKEIGKSGNLTAMWLLLFVLTLTCSIFTPYVGVTNWDLSIFRIGELERAEHVGNFIGVVVGALWKKSWCNIMLTGLIYITHVLISILLTCYVHSYRVSLNLPMQPVVAITCLTAALGSFLSVIGLAQFFDIYFDISCCNQYDGKGDLTNCCRDDDSEECLCTGQFSTESCGKCPNDENLVEKPKIRVFVPPNNMEMYKIWLPEYCLYCWLYRHNPTEVCEVSKSDEGEGEEEDDDDEEEEESTTQNCHVKKYLLRNCKVSICPYCDMNLLLECEELKCTCVDKCSIPLPNANKHEDEEEEEEDKKEDKEKEDTDDKPIKLQLHEMKLPCGSNVSLVTNASSDYVIVDSACCVPKTCKNPKEEATVTKQNGRTFGITSVRAYSCCHYPLKVMISCKDPKSSFHVMQQPYPGKYNPVGAIVFNGFGSVGSVEQGKGKCVKEGKKECPKEGKEKEKNKKKIKESCDSQQHALLCSRISSLTKLGWTEDPKGQNGLCVCCNHADEYHKKQSSTSEQQQQPQQQQPSSTENSTCQSGESKAEGTTTPKCCHIKVQPTALPYHFRKKDICRSHVVGALLFGFLFYGIAKLLSAGIFAVVEIRYGLDLSSNFSLVQPFYTQSEDATTYGIQPDMTDDMIMELVKRQREEVLKAKAAAVATVESIAQNETHTSNEPATTTDTVEQKSDADTKERTSIKDSNKGDGDEHTEQPPDTTASEGDKDDEGAEKEDEEEEEDEEKLPLIKYEEKKKNEVMLQYKWLFNDLEYAYLENWGDEVIDMKTHEEDVEKIKKMRRVKWCLESGLKDYALQSANRITQYLEYMEGKWRAEWAHHESRVKHKFQVIRNNLSVLSPLNSGKVTDKNWQPSVTQAKVALWKSANEVINGLTAVTQKLEVLKHNLDVAEGTQHIVELLNLWDFRVEVINELTKEQDLSLGWSTFLASWNHIKRWTELFLPMYLEEYKGLNGENFT